MFKLTLLCLIAPAGMLASGGADYKELFETAGRIGVSGTGLLLILWWLVSRFEKRLEVLEDKLTEIREAQRRDE